jgi:hypothetical protein
MLFSQVSEDAPDFHAKGRATHCTVDLANDSELQQSLEEFIDRLDALYGHFSLEIFSLAIKQLSPSSSTR